MVLKLAPTHTIFSSVDFVSSQDEINAAEERPSLWRARRFSKDELDVFAQLHSAMNQKLEGFLSDLLQTDVQVNFRGVEPKDFRNFLTQNSFILSAVPVSGEDCLGSDFSEEIKKSDWPKILINLPELIVSPILDRMLGAEMNTGMRREESRTKLTSLEEKLLERVLTGFYRTLSEAWRPVVKISFHTAHLEKISFDTRFVVMNFSVCLFGFSAMIACAFCCPLVGGLLSLMHPLSECVKTENTQNHSSGERSHDFSGMGEEMPQKRETQSEEMNGFSENESSSAGQNISERMLPLKEDSDEKTQDVLKKNARNLSRRVSEIQKCSEGQVAEDGVQKQETVSLQTERERNPKNLKLRRRKRSAYPETKKDPSVEIAAAIRTSLVEVRALMPGGKVSPQEILEWKIGDVIHLNRSQETAFTVFVEDTEKFTALPGKFRQRKVIRIL
ncbi:MAG: FliM/FliN family flagellar motor switch protein [Planctomycetia bacterium]|nr:FliM/FliN family flagellar motor switch protein [Planctomycetia bacterium]